MNEDQHEPELPNTEIPESEILWQRWRQYRRTQTVNHDFADRVMNAVTATTVLTHDSEDTLLVRIGISPWARIGVCSVAMLVGMLPFLYLAMAAKLLPF
ncbi:MAG TPA: hypothetical protein QF564_11900 [Pirellulaceae bacterium]|jgi:hypothetical protein|nr:hypothetical protein [Pirellulaceae bacterium]